MNWFGLVWNIQSSKQANLKLKFQVSVNSDLEKIQVLKIATDSKFEPRFDLLTS